MLVTITASLPNETQLASQLLAAVAKEVRRRVILAVPSIRARIALAIDQAVVSSPEFASLIGGKLQAQLGVRDPVPALRAVVDGITKGMEVVPLSPIGDSVGGVSVHILRTDLSEVLGSPLATFVSEGGYRIDWLNWLLTAGDAIVIADYEFVPGNSAASRTKLGVMLKRGGWRVPPEFAGTTRDNWLTRALGTLDASVEAILTEEVARVL